MSILRRAAREARGISLQGLDDPRYLSRMGGYTASFAGVPVTEITALQHITVWSCVNLISDLISTMPLGAFRKGDKSRTPITDPPLLVKPHPETYRSVWVHQWLVSSLIRGNSFGRVVDLNAQYYPSAVKVLYPGDVNVKRNKDTNVIEYKVKGEADVLRAWPNGDIVHMRGMMLPGGTVGLSPIDFARQTIGTGLAAEEFGGRYFGDGAFPSGMLISKTELKREAALALKAQWLADHGQRNRTPAVVSGDITWQQLSVNPDESQFLQTIDAGAGRIASFYRIPPHLVGDMQKTTSWGAGIEEQNLGLITFTLAPWIVRCEEVLSDLLPRGQYAKFNVAAILRGRLLDRYKGYLMGRQSGFLTINDILEMEDLPPMTEPGGDDHLMPLNFAPVEQAPAIEADKEVPAQ